VRPTELLPLPVLLPELPSWRLASWLRLSSLPVWRLLPAWLRLPAWLPV
jgi:hypothetical protein